MKNTFIRATFQSMAVLALASAAWAGPMEDGQAALKAGDAKAAETKLAEYFTGKVPASDQKLQAFESYVQACAVTGNLHSAAAALEAELTASKDTKPEYISRIAFLLGQLYDAMGKTDEARDKYEYAKKTAPNGEYLKGLAFREGDMLYSRRKGMEAAIAMLDQAAAQDAANPLAEMYKRVAINHMLNVERKKDKAVDEALEYVKAFPKSPYIKQMLDDLRLQCEGADRARLGQAYLALFPDDPSAGERWLDIARELAKAPGQKQAAAECFDKAFAGNLSGLRLIEAAVAASAIPAKAAAAVNMVEKALPKMKGAEKKAAYEFLFPRVAVKEYSEYAGDDGKWASEGKAKGQARKAALLAACMGEFGKGADLLAQSAALKEEMGAKAEAMALYQEAYKLNPDYNQGGLLDKMQALDKDAALAFLKAAAKETPAWAAAKGRAYLILGDLLGGAGDEAKAAYVEAIKANDKFATEAAKRLLNQAKEDAAALVAASKDITLLSSLYPSSSEARAVVTELSNRLRKAGKATEAAAVLAPQKPAEGFPAAYRAFAASMRAKDAVKSIEALRAIMKDYKDMIPQSYDGQQSNYISVSEDEALRTAVAEALWAEPTLRSVGLGSALFFGYSSQRQQPKMMAMGQDLAKLMSPSIAAFCEMNLNNRRSFARNLREASESLKKQAEFLALANEVLEPATRKFAGDDELSSLLSEMVAASSSQGDWKTASALLRKFSDQNHPTFREALGRALQNANEQAPEDAYKLAEEVKPLAYKNGWGWSLSWSQAKDRLNRNQVPAAIAIYKAALAEESKVGGNQEAAINYWIARALFDSGKKGEEYYAALADSVKACIEGRASWNYWQQDYAMAAAAGLFRNTLGLDGAPQSAAGKALVEGASNAFPAGPGRLYSRLLRGRELCAKPETAVEGRIMIMDALYSGLQAKEGSYGAPAWKDIMGIANKHFQAKEYGPSYWLAKSLNDAFSADDSESKKLAENCEGQLVGLTGQQEAGLVKMNDFVRRKETGTALDVYHANAASLDADFQKLSSESLQLIANDMIDNAEYPKAEALIKRFLSTRTTATPHEKAMFKILIGDRCLAERNYERALLEYEIAANEFATIPDGRTAQFKRAQTYIEMKNYGKAKDIIERLMQHATQAEERAEGNYYLGLLFYHQDQADEAVKCLRVVQELDAGNRRGSLLLSQVLIKQGKFMEAYQILKRLGESSKRRQLDPGQPLEIMVTDSSLTLSRGRDFIPVRVWTMKNETTPDGKPVLDKDGKAKEVDGDKLLVKLWRDATNPNQFSASVLSRLGKPDPSNSVLEVTGRDTIYYMYEPEKDAKNLVWQTVEVASDATFQVSSSDIEDEEKAKERTIEEDFGDKPKEKPGVAALDLVRDAKKIRPGGFAYFKVKDHDRDLSDEADTVTVTVVADSGDEELVTLSEAKDQPHSGIFYGKVRTAVKPADCQASSTATGTDPSSVISPPFTGEWQAIAGAGLVDKNAAKKPAAPGAKPTAKDTATYFQVDMKAIQPVSSLAVGRFPTGAGAKKGQNNFMTSWVLQASIDGKDFENIASYPAGDEVLKGALSARVFPFRGALPGELDQCRSLAKGDAPSQTFKPGAAGWANPLTLKSILPQAQGALVAIQGNFLIEKGGLHEFNLTGAGAYIVAIDGKALLFAGTETAKAVLDRGRHSLEVFWIKDQKGLEVKVKDADGKETAGLPASWFSVKDHPDILEEDACIPTVKEGEGAPAPGEDAKSIPASYAISFSAPVKARILRFVIREFKGEAPAIGSLKVMNALNTQVIPTDVDVTKLKNNNALEITPGDEVRCDYTDEFNFLREDVPYKITQALNATYYNGFIESIHTEFADVGGGNRLKTDFALKRFRAGERVSVRVTEYDADLTDQRDRLQVVAKAKNSGQEIRFDLLETLPRSGIFEGEFETVAGSGQAVPAKAAEAKGADAKPADAPAEKDAAKDASAGGEAAGKEAKGEKKGGAKVLAVAPGEAVIIAYNDKENTDPGVAIDREVVVEEAIPSDPRIRVLESRSAVEKLAAAAGKDGKPAPKTDKAADGKDANVRITTAIIGRDKPWATGKDAEKAALITINAPLTVQVRDPSKALHGGSTIPVQVVAKSGDKVAMVLHTTENGLENGYFEGELYLNLGDASSPRVQPVQKMASSADSKFNFSISSSAKESGSGTTKKKSSTTAPKQEISKVGEMTVEKVLNVSGGDRLTVIYDPEATMASSKDKKGKSAKAKAAADEPADAKPADDAAAAGGAAPADGAAAKPAAKAGKAKGGAEGEDLPPVGPKAISAIAQIVTNANIGFYDSSYEDQRNALYLGDSIYLKVDDPDADTSQAQDTVKVQVTSGKDAKPMEVTLSETSVHSGIFTRMVNTSYRDAKGDTGKSGEVKAEKLKTTFGETIAMKYVDTANTQGDKPVEVEATMEVHKGDTGRVDIFGKQFADARMAVKTQLNIAEAYFELAKKHRELKQAKLAEEEVARSRAVLAEAIKDYPNTDMAVQAQFLLANMEEEYENFDAAIERYKFLLQRWPDSEFAPQSQFKVAMCYEKAKDFDKACEEYVTVAYRWPDNPLVGDVIIRIGNYFFTRKEYINAAQVYAKLPQRFKEHELAQRAYYKVGECYLKAEEWEKAAETLEQFLVEYPSSDLKAEIMYWTGYAHFNNTKGQEGKRKAYGYFKNVVNFFPDTVWAKYARKFLLDPAMDNFAKEE